MPPLPWEGEQTRAVGKLNPANGGVKHTTGKKKRTNSGKPLNEGSGGEVLVRGKRSQVNSSPSKLERPEKRKRVQKDGKVAPRLICDSYAGQGSAKRGG